LSARWFRPGTYDQPVNHFNVLRTIEDMYDLLPLGAAADADVISGIFA
jgi:acid phosphatase